MSGRLLKYRSPPLLPTGVEETTLVEGSFAGWPVQAAAVGIHCREMGEGSGKSPPGNLDRHSGMGTASDRRASHQQPAAHSQGPKTISTDQSTDPATSGGPVGSGVGNSPQLQAERSVSSVTPKMASNGPVEASLGESRGPADPTFIELEPPVGAGSASSHGPVGADVAEQLDQLGDAMLAEVEAALEADAKGEGFRALAEPGQRKLTRLASLDVLSEILSWEGFDSPGKREEDGVVDSSAAETQVSNERKGGAKSQEEEGGKGEAESQGQGGGGKAAAPSEALVDALLKGYDRAVDAGRRGDKGSLQAMVSPAKRAPDECRGVGTSGLCSGLLHLDDMEVDQELMNALRSENRTWDEHDPHVGGKSASPGLQEQTSPRGGVTRGRCQLETLGGLKRKLPEGDEKSAARGGLSGVPEKGSGGMNVLRSTLSILREQLMHGLDGHRDKQADDAQPTTPQPRSPRAIPSSFKATRGPLNMESGTSTLTHAGSNFKVGEKTDRHPGIFRAPADKALTQSLPSSPVTSPLPSPKTAFRSQSFKEATDQGRWSHHPSSSDMTGAANFAQPRGSKPQQPPGGGDSQRMRFTPQQQKELHAFGTKVNWVGPGIEALDEAHQICAEMGMDIKQLKKWISNHRPKEFRTSTSAKSSTQPPWINVPPLPPSVFQGVYSEAALRTLNAVQPALMGPPFMNQFENPSFFPGPPLPSAGWGPPPYAPGGMWPWGAPGALFPMQAAMGGPEAGNPELQQGLVSSSSGAQPELGNATSGGHGALLERGLSRGGSVELAGGKGLSLEMARLANADNLRQVLGRKLKDFDPSKVQKLVELCKKYRQKRASHDSEEAAEGPSHSHSGPPTKRQLTSPSENPPDKLAEDPPPLDLGKPMKDEQEGAYRPQWGEGLLEDPPPYSDKSLASFLSSDTANWGWDAETAAAVSCALGLDKAGNGLAVPVSANPTLTRQCTLPVISSELVKEFSRTSDVDIFGQGISPGDPNLLNPNVFFNSNAVAAIPPNLHGFDKGFEVAPGLGNGFYYNPAPNPSLDGVPSFPLETGNELLLGKEGRKGATGTFAKTPQVVLAPHLKGGCPQPSSKKDRKDKKRHDAAASRAAAGDQKQLRGTYLFEKVLTASDTSPLGRIILPKSQAELHLPKVFDKEGGLLTVEDADRKKWEVRYRFWPNNKSRIYVFEHIADFIQSRGLRPGDVIVVCRAAEGHLILNDRKRPQPPEENTDKRPASEGSSTVSSGSSCTRGRDPQLLSADEHADSRTLMNRSGTPTQCMPLQQTWRQLSMEDVTRWAMTSDGQDMMDCVNLDHVDPQADEPHMLELTRDFQYLQSSSQAGA